MATTVKINGNDVTISGLALDPRPSKRLLEKGKGNMLLVSTSEKLQVTLPDGRTITATLSLNLHCPPHLLKGAPKAPEETPLRVTETGVVTDAMDPETKRLYLAQLGYTQDEINAIFGHPMKSASKS